jgi:hypothetical protein
MTSQRAAEYQAQDLRFFSNNNHTRRKIDIQKTKQTPVTPSPQPFSQIHAANAIAPNPNKSGAGHPSR